MKEQMRNQIKHRSIPLALRLVLIVVLLSLVFLGSCSLSAVGNKAKATVSEISRTVKGFISRVRGVSPETGPKPTAVKPTTAPGASTSEAALDRPELEAPSRGATIETPRIVMRSLVDEAAPVKKSVGDRVDLRVPNSTEAPRLPADYEIGPLGWGDVDRAAYDVAMAALNKAAKTGKAEKVANSPIDEQSLKNLAALGSDPQVHIGSPLVQVEGTLSFLVRFIGKELTCAGEIHLSSTDGENWTVDALLLDLPILKVQEGDKSELSFDPLTYKRFF